MSKSKFNALASLAVLAAAPMAAQAEMVEMADTEMSDVSGQALIGDTIGAVFGSLIDPLINSGTTEAYVVTSCTGACTYNADGSYNSGGTPTYTRTVKTDTNYFPSTIGSIGTPAS